MTRPLTVLIAGLVAATSLAVDLAPAQAWSRGETNAGSTGLTGVGAGSGRVIDVSGMDLGSGR